MWSHYTFLNQHPVLVSNPFNILFEMMLNTDLFGMDFFFVCILSYVAIKLCPQFLMGIFMDRFKGLGLFISQLLFWCYEVEELFL